MTIIKDNGLLPKVQTRMEFMDCLESMMDQPTSDGEAYRGRPRELKTYIIESDGGFPQRFECANGVFGEVRDTGIDQIKILKVFQNDNKLEFFLDVSDNRFFTLHTNARSEDVSKAVGTLTGDRNNMFDNTWFYSDMLKKFAKISGNSFMGFGVSYTTDTLYSDSNEYSDIESISLNISGSLASTVQSLVEKEPRIGRIMAYNKVGILRGQPPDSIQDDVYNNGYFAVKRGRSIQDHLQLVDICKDEYSQTINRIEKSSIGINKEGDRMLVGGGSFDFEFENEIGDIDTFIRKMFNSTEPFRMWGLKSKIDDDYYSVAAVDLHAGNMINFDIAKDMIRVYLYKGCCGNTVLRLFTNLQINFDSKIRCKQLYN